MKHLSSAASALLLIAGAFVGSCDRALAFPIEASAAAPQNVVVKVLCKYGTKHCVNPNPGPKFPKVGGAQLPPNGWQDPDCKYYGNCNTGGPGDWGDPSAGRKGPSGTRPGHSGTVRITHAGSAKH